MADSDVPQDSTQADVREQAMRLLVSREHSHRELCRKLIERSLDAQVVPQVVSELANEGLQSDLRFAEAYARSRATRGFGLAGIIYELKRRGVASQVIDRALDEAAIDWGQVAQAALAKKFARSGHNASQQSKMRRHLYTRGFDGEQATVAIRNHCSDVQS